MTGYGYNEFTVNGTKMVASIKSVNSRYLDINVNLPGELNRVEESIVKLVKSMFERGKLDIYIGVDKSTFKTNLELNNILFNEYIKLVNTIKKKMKITDDLCIGDVFGFNGMVINKNQANKISFNKEFKNGVHKALVDLEKMRKTEGDALKRNFISIIKKMEESLKKIYKRLPTILNAYKKRIKSKIEDVLNVKKYDENRILMEVALLSDKMDINEELERLKSHLAQMKKHFKSKKSCGRLMEFLLQEMLREVNTIGSKVSDINVTQDVILLKEYVEQFREQARNIE